MNCISLPYIFDSSSRIGLIQHFFFFFLGFCISVVQLLLYNLFLISLGHMLIN